MTIKATSELLLRTLDSDVNPAIKAERLQRFRGLIGAVEDTFGKNHRYVRVWRAIHSIGKAELDGTPQPDDKELGLNAKCFVATVLLRIGRLPRSSKASSLSRSGHATAPEWTAFCPFVLLPGAGPCQLACFQTQMQRRRKKIPNRARCQSTPRC